jgi:stress-induced morphogen
MRLATKLLFRNTFRCFNAEEARLKKVLEDQLKATSCIVEDVSGGCGAMYKVFVKSKVFQGLPMVKQHQLVANTLNANTEEVHGWTIKTETDKETP